MWMKENIVWKVVAKPKNLMDGNRYSKLLARTD